MTGQNTSPAVMQQRREPDDSLDDFPTPPWATRALMHHVLWRTAGTWPADHFARLTAWDPCCNRGHMVRPMREVFARVSASDIFDYSTDPDLARGFDGQDRVCDFLMPDAISPMLAAQGVDWIFINPPFRLAAEFIARACAIARHGVAAFVRTGFLHGGDRWRDLYRFNPPTVVGYFAERVVIHKGVLRDPGVAYWDAATGRMKRPSTATDYVWLCWIRGQAPRAPVWIPPCRASLERPGDYPPATPGPDGGAPLFDAEDAHG